VTARQARDYLALIKGLPNGRCVNAGQQHAAVVRDACDLILSVLAARIERRFGLGGANSAAAPLTRGHSAAE
jgi:hypothetical protein